MRKQEEQTEDCGIKETKREIRERKIGIKVGGGRGRNGDQESARGEKKLGQEEREGR